MDINRGYSAYVRKIWILLIFAGCLLTDISPQGLRVI